MNANYLDIRIKLLKKGYTLASVGRMCGAHRNVVQYAIKYAKGKYGGQYIEIQRTIAEILGNPPERLWPKIFKKAA